MATYDKHYQKKDYFGEPFPELMEFFNSHEPKGKVLDLGCGQGRDSIPIARMGYKVTGVDISKLGIEQMLETGLEENLDLTGIVEDMDDFKIDEDVDIILLDSMFHFYKNDMERETGLLADIMMGIRPGGIIALTINKSKKAEKVLEDIIFSTSRKWEVIKDAYDMYPSEQVEFRILIVKKPENDVSVKCFSFR